MGVTVQNTKVPLKLRNHLGFEVVQGQIAGNSTVVGCQDLRQVIPAKTLRTLALRQVSEQTMLSLLAGRLIDELPGLVACQGEHAGDLVFQLVDALILQNGLCQHVAGKLKGLGPDLEFLAGVQLVGKLHGLFQAAVCPVRYYSGADTLTLAGIRVHDLDHFVDVPIFKQVRDVTFAIPGFQPVFVAVDLHHAPHLLMELPQVDVAVNDGLRDSRIGLLHGLQFGQGEGSFLSVTFPQKPIKGFTLAVLVRDMIDDVDQFLVEHAAHPVLLVDGPFAVLDVEDQLFVPVGQPGRRVEHGAEKADVLDLLLDLDVRIIPKVEIDPVQQVLLGGLQGFLGQKPFRERLWPLNEFRLALADTPDNLRQISGRVNLALPHFSGSDLGKGRLGIRAVEDFGNLLKEVGNLLEDGIGLLLRVPVLVGPGRRFFVAVLGEDVLFLGLCQHNVHSAVKGFMIKGGPVGPLRQRQDTGIVDNLPRAGRFRSGLDFAPIFDRCSLGLLLIHHDSGVQVEAYPDTVGQGDDPLAG